MKTNWWKKYLYEIQKISSYKTRFSLGFSFATRWNRWASWILSIPTAYSQLNILIDFFPFQHSIQHCFLQFCNYSTLFQENFRKISGKFLARPALFERQYSHFRSSQSCAFWSFSCRLKLRNSKEFSATHVRAKTRKMQTKYLY